MSTKRERRKWALETAAALLRSDMDCYTVDEVEDEDEQDKYRDEVRAIANELDRKAKQFRSHQ